LPGGRIPRGVHWGPKGLPGFSPTGRAVRECEQLGGEPFYPGIQPSQACNPLAVGGVPEKALPTPSHQYKVTWLSYP